ncbi:MAG: DinB family protein [Flavobacteriaceae bacterium]
MQNHNFLDDFKKNAVFRIDESTRMIEKSLLEITFDELWQKPNESLNSIGNLLLHLCGNMTQYVVSSLGNLPDYRNREEEFTITGGFSKKALLQKLQTTLEMVKKTIQETSEEQFAKERSVQGFTLSGTGIVLHVVEHYSYHTGQIAFWVKLLKNKDLGFYENIDLNSKN